MIWSGRVEVFQVGVLGELNSLMTDVGGGISQDSRSRWIGRLMFAVDTMADLRPAAPEGCCGHTLAPRAQAMSLWFQIFKYSLRGNLVIYSRPDNALPIPPSVIWWGLETLCRHPKSYCQRSLPSFFSSFLSLLSSSLLFLRIHSLYPGVGGNICKLKICFLKKNHGTPEILFSSYICFAFK